MPSLNELFAGSREVFLRIGIGALGFWLISIGLIILIFSNKDVQSAVKDGTKVATDAAVTLIPGGGLVKGASVATKAAGSAGKIASAAT